MRLNTDLSGDATARQSTDSPDVVMVKTPWTQIDDVFYEARGSAWALVHFLHAMEVDFEDVLRKKNAQVSFRQIIRELECEILERQGYNVLSAENGNNDIFCHRCGKRAASGDRFCRSCGTKLRH